MTVRVAVVCLGNICRSPMAAAVLRRAVADAGLADEVEVVSAGTAGYHVGDPADPRARAALRRRGYDDAHTARRFAAEDFATVDLVLAMDEANRADLLALAATPEERPRSGCSVARATCPTLTTTTASSGRST